MPWPAISRLPPRRTWPPLAWPSPLSGSFAGASCRSPRCRRWASASCCGRSAPGLARGGPSARPRWRARTATRSCRPRPSGRQSARPTSRPVPLSAGFTATYGPSAAGRVVSVRLSHPRPDAAVIAGNGAAGSAPPRDWPLRVADFDTAGHVNNAVHWAVVEDELATAAWLPSAAEVEYQRAILPGCLPRLVTDRRVNRTSLWLLAGERVLASALLIR